MTNPVFELYERTLVAEAVENHYGSVALYNEDVINERYFNLQMESVNQISICNTAAEGLYNWLSSNTSMSMEQAVLVSKHIDLIEKTYPGLYQFNLVTSESESDSDRLALVTEAFNPKIFMSWAIALTVILGLIRFFSSKKSPAVKKEKTISARLEKIEKTLEKNPKTVEEVPKPSGICTEKNQTAYKLSKHQVLLGSLGTLDPNKDISANEIIHLFNSDFLRKSNFFWSGKVSRYNILDVFKKVDKMCDDLLRHMGELDLEEFKKDPNNKERSSIENTDLYKATEKEIMNVLFGDRSFGKIVLSSKELPETYALVTDKQSFNGVEYVNYTCALRSVNGDTVIDALDTKQRLALFERSKDIFTGDWSFSTRKETAVKRTNNRNEWADKQAKEYERAIASVKSLDSVFEAANKDNTGSDRNLKTVATLIRFYHNHKSAILKKYMEIDIHQLDFENAFLQMLEHALSYDKDVIEI